MDNCTIHEGLRDSSGEAEYCCFSTADDCCAQPAQLFTAAAWSFTSSPSSLRTSSVSSATSSATSSTASNHTGTDYKGIGIGVGVGITVALAAISIIGFVRRRHRRRRGHHSVGSSSPADSIPPSRPPVQERSPAAYSDHIDERAIGTRTFELETMRKPLELHGSEPETRDLNNFTPRILRPLSVDKLD
jgi:hypothetical protein